MSAKSSVRYDYAVGQDVQAKLRVVEGSKKQPYFDLKFYVVGLVCVLMVAGLLLSRVQLTENTERLNTSTKDLGILESEELILRTKLEDKISVSNVEEKAEARGMRKTRSEQIDYINVSRTDELKEH
ncbi:hypothetical protein FACS1894198_5110 [Clostridia bacterium]|nr:hypothetical protein FACS1894198_5110 [Clostridia bacterium]